MTELADSRKSESISGPSGIDRQGEAFLFSAFMFRIGLALVTFEQVYPFGIMLSDYCFFFSLLLVLDSLKSRLLETRGSGILLAGTLIFSGALLSLTSGTTVSAAIGPLTKLFVLYGLFAPLAMIHSKNIRKNMLFLIGGISVNCAITALQASLFPGIVKALSINPMTPDQSEMELRFQGLTGHPVTLGLSAALAVLITVGLMLFERRRYVRWVLALLVLICADAALLSGSRTFLAALIVGLVVLAFLVKQHRRIVVRALITVLILLGGLTYLLPSAMSQFSARLEDVGLVDYGRLMVATEALTDISQKPILGWGVDHLAEAGLTWIPGIFEPQAAHVTFLQYWYGTGLLGAIGFLALFVIPVKRMMQVLRKRPSDNSTNAVRLIFACYASFFTIFNLGPYLHNRFLYMPMFVFAGFTARLLSTAKVPSAASPRPVEPAGSSLGSRQARQTPGAA